jgi:predicted helicase
MTTTQYIEQIAAAFKLGNATEHSYRGYLQTLIESLVIGIRATNEPKRQACGAPDYILTKNEIPVGYIEAKDIGDKDLEGAKKTGNKEQFDRYKSSLGNLIFTDYLTFRLYVDGDFKTEVTIGEIVGNTIKGIPQNFAQFESLMRNFATHVGQTIKSSKTLAEMMAVKARMLAETIEAALTSDVENNENSTLQGQMDAFKTILIHDITPREFADIYAQTIAYGMFAARLHDPSLPTFTRQEAAELIPKTNPFLRKLFQYIAGYDLDTRIAWIVDALADIFRATDVAALLKTFGRSTQTTDPVIHFYETFLAEYDPRLRKARGVWYTPEPVVNFIVRAVDELLKTEFGIKDGLASSEIIEKDVATQELDKRKQVLKTAKQKFHRVQILDPAAGTGTFLAEVVRHIFKKFGGQQGIWSSYVEEHLIPRLNGFEILMASYAMAHLKLDMLLAETGFKAKKEQRFKIYLTNSLEEHHPDTGTLFANWLSNEANEANYIKRDTSVMVVLGNPPYSGISKNNGDWITNLIEDYKYVDGEHFGERKHWLQDDYVKFLRFGEYFVEKNGEGVLAFINNHGFLDNPTFRGMRWHLLKTFDKIYVIDLHGNSKKSEAAPDGGKDENVFDIMQGVSINLFLKTGKKKKDDLAEVLHFDLYGKRESKYDFLFKNSLKSIDFKNIELKKPLYFFVPKNYTEKGAYDTGFAVNEIFQLNVTGILTARDKFVIDFEKENLLKRIQDFTDSSRSDDETRAKFFGTNQSGQYPPGDSRGWKLPEARRIIKDAKHEEFLKEYTYRPFDNRVIYYHSKMVDWGREKVMQHFLKGDNLALVTCRQSAIDSWEHCNITKNIVDDSFVSNRTKERGYVFPLYLYPEESAQETIGGSRRTPNLNMEIIGRLSEAIGQRFTPEPTGAERSEFAPVDVLDYIYATLHSPTYRDTYREFLKIDFPRVPYPASREEFWRMVRYGSELRALHLLEGEPELITQYPMDGDNTVLKGFPKYADGRVSINADQYFDGVPESAWNFYIGGYQPAQKWLKDRVGRVLSFEDILHYQRMIVALARTAEIMNLIDSEGV